MNFTRIAGICCIALTALAVAGCGGGDFTRGDGATTVRLDEETRKNFLTGCASNVPSTITTDRATQYCYCVLSYIEAHVSRDQLRAAEAQSNAGQGMPEWMLQAARSCGAG